MKAIRELTYFVVAAFLVVVGFGVLFRNEVIAFPDLGSVSQAVTQPQARLIVTSQTLPLSGAPKLKATLAIPTAIPTPLATEPPAPAAPVQEPTSVPLQEAQPTAQAIAILQPTSGPPTPIPAPPLRLSVPTVVSTNAPVFVQPTPVPQPTPAPTLPPAAMPTAAPTAQAVALAAVPAPAAAVQSFRGDMMDAESGAYIATVTYRSCTRIGPLDVNLNDSCETARTVRQRCNIVWAPDAAPSDDTGLLTDNQCQPAAPTFRAPMPVQIRP